MSEKLANSTQFDRAEILIVYSWHEGLQWWRFCLELSIVKFYWIVGCHILWDLSIFFHCYCRLLSGLLFSRYLLLVVPIKDYTVDFDFAPWFFTHHIERVFPREIHYVNILIIFVIIVGEYANIFTQEWDNWSKLKVFIPTKWYQSQVN